MQENIKPKTISINLLWIFSLVLSLILIKSCSERSRWRNRPIGGEIHSITCISERGDTIARFQTREFPHMWTDYDGLTVMRFTDEATKKFVEIRTKTGTIIWQ